MTRWLHPFLLLLVLLLSGCSLQIVPRSGDGVTFDSSSRLLTAEKDGIAVSVRVQDTDVGPFTGQNTITSFYVVIANNSRDVLDIPLEAFTLFDAERRVFRPLPPDRAVALTRREANYLIPYPYVGFYYLQNDAEFDFTNATSSDFRYSPPGPEQNILADALPVGRIPAGSKIFGMLYFNIDLYRQSSVQFDLQVPPRGLKPAADFRFDFDVKQ